MPYTVIVREMGTSDVYTITGAGRDNTSNSAKTAEFPVYGFIDSSAYVYISGKSNSGVEATFDAANKTLTWYSSSAKSHQLNNSNVTYTWFAMC